MANYQLLKADIDEKVYQNGHQEITGENLNAVLNAMVTTLGAGYQFAGVATIGTNPGTPDAKVFYIANGKGTYTNFSNLEVTEDDVVVLYYDTEWHKVATGIASNEKLTELGSKVDNLDEIVKGTNKEDIPVEVEYLEGLFFDMSAVPSATTYSKREGQATSASVSYTPCKCAKIEVKEGDVIYINGKAGNRDNYGLYVLTDTATNIIGYELSNTEHLQNDLKLNIEQDGYLYVNLVKYTSENYVKKTKVISTKGLTDDVNEIKKKYLSLADFAYDKNNNTYTISKSVLGEAWRIYARFKVNGYAEVDGRSTIAQVGIRKCTLLSAPNSLMTYSQDAGWLRGTYPIPKRNLAWSTNRATGTFSESDIKEHDKLSLPNHNEIIGKDVFSIRYKGGNLESYSNNMMLNYDGSRITIESNGTPLYRHIIPTSIIKVNELVDYLNADSVFNTKFEAKLLTYDSVNVSDLAPITQVCLVSEYWATDYFPGATRYDAFPCYFQTKIDETIHDIEIVCKDGIVLFAVDGHQQMREKTTHDVGIYDNVILGSNDVVPIDIISAEIDVDGIGNAEIVKQNGLTQIVSEHNPSLICYMCHGIEEGGIDEELGSDGDGLSVSISRLDKMFGELNRRGYVCLQASSLEMLPSVENLPKRCFVFIIDGERHSLFEDIKIQSVFAKHNVQPSLAVTFRNTGETGVDFEYIRGFADKVRIQGWNTLHHGLNHIKVSSMSYEQLFDLSTQLVETMDGDKHIVDDGGGDGNSGSTRTFSVQCQSCNLAHSYLYSWVYAGGSANPNTIKAFERNGIRAGYMTPIYGSASSRFCNRYFISRLNVQNGDKTCQQLIDMMY